MREELLYLSNDAQRELLAEARVASASSSTEEVLRWLWEQGYVIAKVSGPGWDY